LRLWLRERDLQGRCAAVSALCCAVLCCAVLRVLRVHACVYVPALRIK
jgi:hypothetical protein